MGLFGDAGYVVQMKKWDEELYFTFQHLSGHLTDPWDRLEPGEIICTTGDTGTPGSYHLHINVSTISDIYPLTDNDKLKFMDPRIYLK